MPPPRARVEVEPGRHRHPRLAQDPGAELAAVAGHLRDVGVDVERPVRRRDAREPRLRQPLEHQRPVGAIDREVRLELAARVERRQRRHLARVRRADEQVLHQPLDPPDVRLRHHHPADPPAGHREVLRERVDHIDLVRDLERRDRPRRRTGCRGRSRPRRRRSRAPPPARSAPRAPPAPASSRSGSPGSPPAPPRDPASGPPAPAGSDPPACVAIPTGARSSAFRMLR